MYMNLECGKCNTELPTKLTYDLHSHFCNTTKSSAKEIAMFQCILYLTKKCEALEKKVAKIQSSTTRLRRKHIAEYLQDIPPPKLVYQDWLSFVEFSETDLQRVIEGDLEDGIKGVLSPLLNDLPIRAFTQNPSVFYVYDQCDWRIMSGEESGSLMRSIARKANRTYTKWYKDNEAAINLSDRKRDESMVLMKKLIATDRNISAIKKWLFSKIAVSLNNVEF